MDGIDIGDIETRFNIDLSSLQGTIDKAVAMFDKMGISAKAAGEKTGKGVVEGMDISKGVSHLSDQIAKMNETFTQGFSKARETTDKATSAVADAGVKNITRMKTSTGKEIESMVRDINAKMEQAKAAQLKLQSLSYKRATVQASGDTGKALQFDSQIANAQASMKRYQNQAKDLALSMSREFNAVPASLKKIANAMDANEAKINSLQARVKSLRSAYSGAQVPVGGDFTKGFKMGDSKESTKIKSQIDKLQGSINKLISENDTLNNSYARTEDRAAALKSALSSVNTELTEQGMASRMASAGMNTVDQNDGKNKSGGFFAKLRSGASNFFNLFNRGSSQATSSTNRMNSGLSSMSRQLRQVGASVFLYQLLGQGIMKLVTWLWQAAQTNKQFATSFNQVRVNLLTAFYPIYTAVMPALNTLMAGLAKATGVLASFIANLFGTTYSAAKQGASGLQSSIQSLNDTSSSSTGVSKAADNAKKLASNTSDATKKAKELQQSLASFDEINTLQQNNDDESGTGSTPDTYTPDTASTPSAGDAGSPLGGADFGAATGNYSTPAWLKAFADAVKAIAKDLWTPIAEAWDAVGDKVVKAFKYALREIWGLVKSIGKSFLEVWTNGTGEKFVENILILLADVLNIIGDIAKAFKDAWNDNGRGTKLIQTIFDAFNAILELLHSIATAFRGAWNDGTGEKIAANILDIFTNIALTIENIAKQMKKAWDDNGAGEKLFSTILGMLNDILDALNKATSATADWASSLDFSPLLDSVNGLLDALRPFAKDIWDGLEWGYENLLLPLAGYTITKLLPDFFDVLAAVFKVFTAVIDDMKPVGKWLWDTFLKPFASWTGGSFHSLMQKIVDILTKFSDWASKHQKIVDAIVVSLAALFAMKVANNWLATATSTLGKIAGKASALGGMKGVIAKIFGKITGLSDLKSAVEDVQILSMMAWDSIKSGVSSIKSLGKASWGGLKSAASSMKSMWGTASKNWENSSMFKALTNGPLQSMKSAGGFSNLSTSGKVVTGLAGAGVALGAGWDIISAIKEKNPTKKFEDFGSGAGTAIGGGLGLYFGGPLGAAIGSQIGSVIGKWAGDGAKSFIDGWNAVGKGKRPDDWLGGLGWDAKQMSKTISEWFSTVVDSISEWLGKALTWIKKHWIEVMAFIINPISGIATWFLKDTKTGKSILNWASKLPAKASDWAKDVGKKISSHIDSGKKTISDAGSRIGKWISDFKDDTQKKLSTWAGDLGGKIHDGAQKAKSLAQRAGSNIGDWVNDFRSNASSTISSWASGLGGKINSGIRGAKTWAQQAGKTLGGWVTSFKDSAGRTLSDWAGGLGSKIGKGLSSGASAVKDGAASIANGIIGVIGGAVNGVIKGINWVLGKVGSKNRLGTWTVPKFATGGRHKGGPALVNDANGPVYQEAYRLPDGRSGLFPAQRNLLLNLPTGTQIMPATRVAKQMMSKIPHYSGGLFDFDFNIDIPNFDFHIPHFDIDIPDFNFDFGNAFGSISSGVSNVVDNAVDTISKFTGNPKGLWNWVVSKYAGLKGKSGLGVDIASGAIGKMASGAISMFKKGLSDFAPASPAGKGVERWRSTVIKALSKNGLSTSSSMVARILRQMNTESGGNEKAVQPGSDPDGDGSGPALGLMQTKRGTFEGNKFPGHGNIFTGYDNLLAALRYAKNKFGPSLSFLGNGHGYENGGLINKEGMYRVGEHDLSEMIIPLTKPARAIELMRNALGMMDMSGYDLVTPDIASESSIVDLPNKSVSTSGLTGQDAQTIGQIIAETIAEIIGGKQSNSDTDMNVSMQVNDDILAQVVIKAINKRIQKLGFNPILL